ncbi:hypothetical protein [Nostoc linckia]|nr:hypothetical protein [Nostoc linckia]
MSVVYRTTTGSVTTAGIALLPKNPVVVTGLLMGLYSPKAIYKSFYLISTTTPRLPIPDFFLEDRVRSLINRAFNTKIQARIRSDRS